MQEKRLGGDVELFKMERNFLDELRKIELENDRAMSYDAETRALNSERTSDLNLEDVKIGELADYMQDVRTQGGLFSESNQQRNPLGYELEEQENGIEAQIVYDHPRGNVVSEITGAFLDDSGYKVGLNSRND